MSSSELSSIPFVLGPPALLVAVVDQMNRHQNCSYFPCSQHSISKVVGPNLTVAYKLSCNYNIINEVIIF